MSQNQRLVEYFVSKFYDKNTYQLAHVVSQDFTFQINGREHIGDFEEYARDKSISAQFGEYLTNPIETKDDRIFSLTWQLVMQNDEEETVSMPGASQIIVEDDKVVHIRVFVDEKSDGAALIRKKILAYMQSQNPHLV